ILSFAPGAFMWLAIFAVPYVVARQVIRDLLAFALGLILLAGVVMLMPLPSIVAAQHRLAAHPFAPVLASGRITPVGDVRYEVRDLPNVWNGHGFEPYPCDGRCLALLFTPGVRTVTVASSPDLTYETARVGAIILGKPAATYRLAPRGTCASAVELPRDLRSLFGKTEADNHALESEWRTRLSGDVCLARASLPKGYDLVLRAGYYQVGDPREDWRPWRLGTSALQVHFQEIRGRDGRVLMRLVEGGVSVLSRPWFITPSGGMENFRFDFPRQMLPPPPRFVTNSPDMFDMLAVAREADLRQALARRRAAILAALNDPAAPVTSPVLADQASYFELLAKVGGGGEDVALVSRLLADPRVTDINGAGLWEKAFKPEQLASWRGPIARKLAAYPLDANVDSTNLGSGQKTWPKGLFTLGQPDESRLISDPARQWLATGAIEHLTDRGTAGAALAAPILASHMRALNDLHGGYAEDVARERHKQVIYSATVALCRMGPMAREQLGVLMAVDPLADRFGSAGRLWDLMMARVGKPIDRFTLPHGEGWHVEGTVEQYRANLVDRLRNYQPDRSCD
ncbi:MAG TPA: hypothetical protein VJ762_02070, partial [Sphingobium sp.]|nr:hypothetical protein [Sphingobium sp.]